MAVRGTRIPTYAFDSHQQLGRYVAQLLVDLMRQRSAVGHRAVVGLPISTAALSVYRELVRMHRDEGLDLSPLVVFTLDEYLGIGRDQLQSHYRWMHEHLLAHVNIAVENIHTLDGMTAPENVDEHCRQYEAEIRRAGGIDLLLLDVARNGRIAFNEPFSQRHSRTRVARLDPLSRRDAASEFFTEDAVPSSALTMGIGTILDARRVLLLAQSEGRAEIVRQSVEGDVTNRVPASFIAEHPDATVLVDGGAASKLTGVATPWVLGNVDWTDAMVKRAVLWLVEQTGTALLKLDDNDFRDHNLHRLLRHHGPAQSLAHRVFRWMMDTIEYHPAGQEPRRVICFSPHPDDDVISMGGTLIRLVEDGHEVHIAYMTSGNIAVFDHDAQRIADLVAEFGRLFGIEDERLRAVESDVMQSLREKKPGETDTEAVRKIKGLIRWSEAKAGAQVCGCREEDLHFLDLPFYRTGTIAKNAIGDEDVRIIRELIERVDPAQIYVAGDLSDPHGTHRVCAEAIFTALGEIEAERGTRPDVLLYRGAWQEWAPHEIEIAVPLSPRDLEQKKDAIFRHESQKDAALFPGGEDPREFWERAWDRNRNTADRYNAIGLPEYFAMEGFVRWNGQAI
ncbi:MAG: glucosamine-6-phosphate deaminase [Planctomycetales bacterium]|nr:glucosamine-6-phosphate deaminase [Planctomycetales bacterium]